MSRYGTSHLENLFKEPHQQTLNYNESHPSEHPPTKQEDLAELRIIEATMRHLRRDREDSERRGDNSGAERQAERAFDLMHRKMEIAQRGTERPRDDVRRGWEQMKLWKKRDGWEGASESSCRQH